MEDKEKQIDFVYLNKWTYIIMTIIFVLLSLFFFSWGQNIFNLNEKIKSDVFGQFGDFFGGVLGTIFALISILLLIRTFYQQQKITNENKKSTDIQRFNDIFFELLSLYQEQTKELQIEGVRDEIINGESKSVRYSYNNKDFFDYNKQVTQERYSKQGSYSKNLREAKDIYSKFYIENKSKIAIYYRTLYRIFDLIHNSNLLDETSKIQYAKIIRAQLTESELFFLRYNALTYYGENFIFLINRYNILKHLPHFELLEFKDWWEHLNNEERTSIDIIFCIIKDTIKDLFKNKIAQKKQVQIPSVKYFIYISLNSISDLSIDFKINNSIQNTTANYIGFDKFTNKEIHALIDCFIKEIIYYSNFKQFNKFEDMIFYSNPISTKKNMTTILIGVKNKNGEKLNFKYYKSIKEHQYSTVAIKKCREITNFGW